MSELPPDEINSRSGNSTPLTTGLGWDFRKNFGDILDMSIDDMRQLLIPYKNSEEEIKIINELSDKSIQVLIRLQHDGLLIVAGDILMFQDNFIENIESFITSERYAPSLGICRNGVISEKSFTCNDLIQLSSLDLEAIQRLLELKDVKGNDTDSDEWKIVANWSNGKYDLYKQLYIENYYTPGDYFDVNGNQISPSLYDKNLSEDDVVLLGSQNESELMMASYTILEVRIIDPSFIYTGGNDAEILEDFHKQLIEKYGEDKTHLLKPLNSHLQDIFQFDQPNGFIRQDSSNCYFVAALWTLTQNPYYRSILVQNLIQINETTWEYTFSDGTKISVNQTDIAEYEKSKTQLDDIGLIVGPIGYKILEIAYIKYIDALRKNRGKNEKGLLGTQGGSALEVLQAFLGDSGEYFEVKTKNLAGMELSTVGFEMLQKGLSNIVANITGPGEYFTYKGIKMANKHAYSVIGYDNKTKIVHVVNPWNTSKILQFEYDEFMSIFDKVTIVFLKP